MATAHIPPFDTVDSREWITASAAVAQYGLPLDVIHDAARRGELHVRSIAGEVILSRAELKALRLKLMAERGCDQCED